MTSKEGAKKEQECLQHNVPSVIKIAANISNTYIKHEYVQGIMCAVNIFLKTYALEQSL